MKAAELLAEEKLADYFKRLVKKHGIKKLGGGAFSQVFQHPQFHNVAVKVYRNKDTVYRRYLAWCMKNQSNPFVPKIIEQVQFTGTSDPYNIVFMQKMEPVGTNRFVNEVAKALGLTFIEREDLYDVYEDNLGSGREFYRFMKQAAQSDRCNPDFARLWAHVASYGVDVVDFHAGNAMMRGRQLVVTDPVALDPTSWVAGV